MMVLKLCEYAGNSDLAYSIKKRRDSRDFNTRFSGITEEIYAQAVLPLAAVRQSLDALINSNTIMIGHALENDLKTLRMIHHRCVDTAIMFPHPAGPPFRRALRVLYVDKHASVST